MVKGLVEEYVNYRKENVMPSLLETLGSGKRTEKTAQQIINLKQEQIEVEDQLQYDQLKSEMTNLKICRTRSLRITNVYNCKKKY